MFIKVLIIWCLVSEIVTDSNFVYRDNDESFDNAVDDCNNRGLELLTMSTYRQYLDARNYLNTNSHSKEVSWLPLVKNTSTNNYQWPNGRVLTELKWRSGEPNDNTGTDCGVMEVSSEQWYTTLCTSSKHYICVGSDDSKQDIYFPTTPGSVGYSVGSTSVDFYTAVLNCQSEGRQLPVAITNLDTDWLNDVITYASLSYDIWLGLIESGLKSDDYFKWVPRTESGDYYRWITGEHLTPPPYAWEDNTRGSRVHYHSDKDWFHSDTNNQTYICQTKSTETTVYTSSAVVRSPDKFVLVSDNALVLGSIRQATTINSLRRFQCALECLRDAGCIQYTIQGYLCRTFGEGLVITDYNGGYKLWQRKIIS